MVDAGGQRAIRFEEPLHSMGEQLNVQSPAMRQALAWWVGSELVRRHPESLRLAEGFVHQYGIALIVQRCNHADGLWHTMAFLVHGSDWAHITNSAWFGSGGERFNWLEVLLAQDRRSYVVQQLERAEGLPVPSSTPPTRASSVGPRLVAAFLERTALGPYRWEVRNGAGSDDDSAWVNMEMFEQFPGALEQLGELRGGDREVPAESRFWFVCGAKGVDAPGEPVAALDVVAGQAWTGPRHVDLLQRYRQLGSRIDALIGDVLPPAR